jgi:hypothetical protein
MIDEAFSGFFETRFPVQKKNHKDGRRQAAFGRAGEPTRAAAIWHAQASRHVPPSREACSLGFSLFDTKSN